MYDRYGNRTFDTTANRTTTIPANCPTAVCNPSADSATNKLIGYQFDNSGNTKADAENRTFIYDSENKQVEVKNASSQTVGQYFYDAMESVSRKYVPSTGETTIFVYDAAGKLVAEYSTIVEPASTAKINYLTNDHLGSPRINTDTTGNVTARHDYHPFGEEIATSQRTAGIRYVDNTVRRQFTGYERDNESELDFAQARYYSSRLGRFYAADPGGAGAMEDYPQSWNAYAYVGNNPLNFTDPDGEKWKVCDNQGICVEISDAEAKRTLFNRSGNHPEIIRKDGKIFDEDGNVSGTYTRTSFDDLSDKANALIFGPNSIGEQGIKKGKLVGALVGGAVLTGACVGTGTCAVVGTALTAAGKSLLRASPSFLRQLAGKDKKILEAAVNNAKGGNGSFASNLEAVSKATSQVIPGGNVLRLGYFQGSPVFGGRSGVGIVEIGGKTMVVKKVGDTFKVLGEFLGK